MNEAEKCGCVIVIVPNTVSEAIYAKLDIEISKCPDALIDREYLYQTLLSYFNEHGVIPEFSLEKRSA